MSFTEDLQKRLSDKGLSQNSIQLYIKNLIRLNSGDPLSSLKLLSKPEPVIEKLNKFKPTTRKSYLTCIISCLSVYPENKVYGKSKNVFYKELTDQVSKMKETPTTEMTKTQNDNWMDWQEVKKLFEERHNACMTFYKNKTITEAQYTQLLNLMVMALYVLLPPRRNQDYMMMNIKKNVKDTDSKEFNYLDLDKQEFIFNVFKTSKEYPNTKEAIPEELQHIISMYLKHQPLLKGKKINKDTNLPFLVYSDGSRLDKVNSITRILNKIFGKNIGVSMLRHSYLTDKYGKDNKERQADAEAMGHSVQTQQSYIKEKKEE